MNTHDKITTRIGLTLFFVMALLAFLANAQFGSFVHDQPFLASSGSGPLFGEWANDTMETYTELDYPADLNDGTNWNGPLLISETWSNYYVVNLYLSFYATVAIDAMEEYAEWETPATNSMAHGTNYTLVQMTNDLIPYVTVTNVWTDLYVDALYVSYYLSNFLDNFETYLAETDMTTNAFASGTNYTTYLNQITNDTIRAVSYADWTDVYVPIVY